MIDWGDEVKLRPHSGMVGLDSILKDARRGDLSAVKAHLKQNPSLLTAMSGGHNRTFLWEATRGNRPELVKYLLKIGANPNVPGRIRSEVVVLLKPYCIARRFGHDDLAVTLLKAGTKLDIYSACYLGDQTRVLRLLSKSAELLSAEQTDDSVWRVTPLHFAVAGGHEDLVRALIKRGAPVAPYARLLSNAAVRAGRMEFISIFLEAGADPTLVEKWAVRQPK
jgi:ankyrin repeat protein